MEKKTHTETKEPRISIRSLGEYMAASERAKRTVVRDCKYRAIARVIQHDEAKLTASKYIRSGGSDPEELRAKAEYIRNKITDTDFEQDTNDHNADYLDRLADVIENIELPKAEFIKGRSFPTITVHGVKVAFTADLVLRRTTKTNKVKAGALALRYSKGKPLAPEVAAYQAAGAFGFLRTRDQEDAAEAERALCLTVDAYAGAVHPAPGDALDRWNDMQAACATIFERWPNIKPPPNAVL